MSFGDSLAQPPPFLIVSSRGSASAFPFFFFNYSCFVFFSHFHGFDGVGFVGRFVCCFFPLRFPPSGFPPLFFICSHTPVLSLHSPLDKKLPSCYLASSAHSVATSFFPWSKRPFIVSPPSPLSYSFSPPETFSLPLFLPFFLLTWATWGRHRETLAGCSVRDPFPYSVSPFFVSFCPFCCVVRRLLPLPYRWPSSSYFFFFQASRILMQFSSSLPVPPIHHPFCFGGSELCRRLVR